MGLETISAVLAVAGILLCWSLPSAAAERPNILVILSDDQGYPDTGFQGSKDIVTPHLDRLAQEGLRCTNGYVSHPFCSPSRAGLLTGRYQARFGHEHNPGAGDGLPVAEKLLPEFLAPAGYATGWIGKWHLGSLPQYRPENRGFQETFGFLGGGHRYLNWQPDLKDSYKWPILRNGKPVAAEEHLTTAFGHEAAAFIKRHTNQPWFLYLAFNAPHTPIEPTAERLARFAQIKDNKRRGYAAQISLMDDAVGQAMESLRRTGQQQRTLVFFLSDNGAPPENGGSNLPLRGWKGDVYDGGIHVPFVVSWPGHLPSGKDYPHPVISLDIFATALACAGVPVPTDKPYDGVNLLPFLSGQTPAAPHERLFWRTDFTLQAAVLDGSMKLVRDKLIFKKRNDHWDYNVLDKPDQVFNLSNDLGEKHDLSKDDAATTDKLRRELIEWYGQMAKHLAFNGDHGPERQWPAHTWSSEPGE